jgi:hypothetical protein
MAQLDTSSINDLPDSAFAYIEAGGTKDAQGKTVPRSKRHFPVHDADHARNALARLSQSEFGDRARSKVLAAARKFGIHVSDDGQQSFTAESELRISSQWRDLKAPLEYRDLGSEGKWIGGYASVFIPKESANLGGFVERVAPHAFDEYKAQGWPNVVCRFNHDSNMILGTTGAQTLRCNPDRVGLDYEVKPPEARADIRELVQRGDIRYSSFAFQVPPGGDEWDVDDRNFPIRTLHNVILVDVAPVLSPGYPDATCAARAMTSALMSLANWAQVSVDEIRTLAADENLRSLFVRTDRPITRPEPKRLFGPSAAAGLLLRRTDPYADDE